MSREIRYRAWDIKNKRFVNIVRLVLDQFGALDYADVVFKGKIYKLYSSEIVLEQYTGLKDIDGKEIYEGDVVEVLGKFSDVYRTDSGEWVLSHFCKDDDPISSLLWHCDKKQVKVVGNVHENQELLGSEE